jgi:DNA-binding PadR family transcriptional regulator
MHDTTQHADNTDSYSESTDSESDGYDGQTHKVWSPHDLTRFQHDLLYVIGSEGPSKGTAIKAVLEERYTTQAVHHGRLYPNLNQLADMGLVDKSERDKRTNEYALTGAGRELLRRDAQWRPQIANQLTGGDA